MYTHVPWHTASHIFIPPLSPPLRLVEEAITIPSAPSHPASFISFVWSPSLSPRVSLQMLYFSELLCMAFCATSACWPPSVSNQSAIKIHTHTDTHHMDLHTVWFISSHVSLHLYKCMQTTYLQIQLQLIRTQVVWLVCLLLGSI